MMRSAPARSFHPWIGLLIATLVVSACSEGPTNPSTSGSLTAVVNGTPFTAIAASATFTGGVLGVGGGNAAGTSVGFAIIPTEVGTGTYTVGLSANGAYSEGTRGWTTAGGSGTFNITTFTSDRVAGTFSFVAHPNAATGATGTITVTQGVFDVPRTDQ